VGVSERNKGKVGEREVAALLAEGWPEQFGAAKRSGDAGQADGDLDHVDPFFVQVKRRENLALPQWIKEVEAECPDYLTPLIVYRRSRMEWRADLQLAAFIRHIRAAS
jgi:hypothetical protein